MKPERRLNIEPHYLRLSEASKYLQISVPSLYRMYASKKYPFLIKVEGNVRFSIDDFREWTQKSGGEKSVWKRITKKQNARSNTPPSPIRNVGDNNDCESKKEVDFSSEIKNGK
jgi:predicted DNA-binding transcriptional regulator AlpA